MTPHKALEIIQRLGRQPTHQIELAIALLSGKAATANASLDGSSTDLNALVKNNLINTTGSGD